MRFRFTIRDLLWLTALVALAVGWWLEHQHINRTGGLAAKSHTLKFVNAKEMRDVLRAIYADRSEMGFAADLNNDAIVVVAPPSLQVEIRTLIEQIDAPATNERPSDVKSALRQILGQ